MSQFDFGDLSSPLSGTAFFNSNLEPWRTALHSNHSGTARPSYAIAQMIWVNTTTTPWMLYMFDGTDDILIGSVNATSNVFTPAGVILNNIVATSAPTVNEDSGDGYSAGSIWINLTTDLVYFCVDASVGAAIWRQVVDTATAQTLNQKTLTNVAITSGTISGLTALTIPSAATATTQTPGDNSTKVSTTAYADAAAAAAAAGVTSALKYWIKFNGTSGATIAGSAGISVSRASTGVYNVTMTALADANYGVSGGLSGNSSNGFPLNLEIHRHGGTAVTPTTTTFTVYALVSGQNNNYADPDSITLHVTR